MRPELLLLSFGISFSLVGANWWVARSAQFSPMATLGRPAGSPLLRGQSFSGTPGTESEFTLISVTRETYLMGTRCTLTTYAPGRQEGMRRLEVLLRVLEETEQELSTWREDSVLTRLNRHPLDAPFALGPRLCRLFRDLIRWHSVTEGAFDPAVGELIEAWQIRGSGRRPSPQELERARRNSGIEHVVLEDDDCRVTRLRPVWIDAGAFGKGEGLDRALDRAREAGYDRWLIDLGGQLLVYNTPPGRAGWSATLAHPRDRHRAVLELELPSGSLATSGGSERDLWVEGERIGHILDPDSGRPTGFPGSVSVWHEQGLTADILSTALYVMGPEKGWTWALEKKVAACFLLLENGLGSDFALRIRTTPAFQPLVKNQGNFSAPAESKYVWSGVGSWID